MNQPGQNQPRQNQPNKDDKGIGIKWKTAGGSRVSQRQSIRDVMTPAPRALDTSAAVMDAAEFMRESDIGDVIVLEEDHLCGIVTDRDIVVRVLAEGANPATVTVGEICSRDLTTISPMASVGDAVRLIRDKAIRRLPVVEEDGEVVGIVSIGDIAVARDRRSSLGDISAARPNT
jgi:CBS domain-containing protein